MSHRSRRRLDIFFLLLVAGALGGAAAVAAAVGDTERITGYWAGARVGVDGNASVVEVIDYEFGVNPRHGIFRDVPGLAPQAPVSVDSPTAPDQFTVTPLALDQRRIRIGDPARTINGRHRYRIEYPISLGFEDDVISWNAVGDSWDVSISDIELHLVGPAFFEEVACSKGSRGSWDGCTATQSEPGHLVVSVDRLGPNEGVTVTGRLTGPVSDAAGLPAPPEGPADDPGAGILKPAVLAAVVALFAALVSSVVVRRAGRELVWVGGGADAAFGPRDGETLDIRRVDHDELDQLATTEFAPPDGLTAWQGGVLLAERVTNDHLSAWLVERAIDGEVEIVGEGKDLTLRQSPDRPPGIDVVSSMFDGRSEVELGEYDSRFAAAWSRLDDQLDDWHEHSGLWDRAGDRRKRSVALWAVLGLVVGIGVMAAGAAAASRWELRWLVAVGIGAAIAGAAGSALVRRWELRVRTPEGSGLWIRVESFRRFLADSDARHAEEAAAKGVLLQYTAWAVAIGEIDQWSKAIDKAGIGAPGSDYGDVGMLHLASVASSLGRAASSASTAPSSSGGGGGGSVGGGGGGGGGGSW